MKKGFICLTVLAMLMLVLAPAVLAVDEQEYQAPYYLEFSGKVLEINPYYNLDGSESGRLFVLTESSDGMLMNFVVDDKTVFLTENELKEGAEIVGFYLGNVPAIMIYPPQMHGAVLAVDLDEATSVKAAMFDETGLSDDGQLKLNLAPGTEVDFSKPLAVFYSVTTRSLPPQTTPTNIIELPLADLQTAKDPEDFAVDGMPLVVANVLLKNAPAIYVHENGTVMIPLRAVAEALGYEVDWVAASRTVTLNGETMAAIGADGVELHEGVTYVPLSFFREVLQLNNAYVLEKQVFIDNDERME